MMSLATVKKLRGDYSSAEILYRRVLAIQIKRLGDSHPRLAMTMTNLGSLLLSQGHFGEAEALLKQALAIYRASLGSDPLKTATAAYQLARVYQYSGRHRQSIESHQFALEIRQAKLGPLNSDVAVSLNSISKSYRALAELDLAEEYARQAEAILRSATDGEHRNLVNTLSNLAGILACMWKVADTPTALLMTRFYENLAGAYEGSRGGLAGESMSKASALREAKLWLRNHQDELGDTPWSHPRHWAAFILIGDPD